MKEKVIDVKARYSFEIQDIKNKLMDLENGRYYENTRYTQDGYLANNIIALRKMLNELITKIEYGDNSVKDDLVELF